MADVCQAFRAIDDKGAGYIETAKMSELLVSKGTPFRAKEIEAFLSIAKVWHGVAGETTRTVLRGERTTRTAFRHYAEDFVGFSLVA